MKIAAFSVLCVDFFQQTHKIFLGGNSLNFAVQCSKERNCQISLIGAIGKDNYGQMILNYLQNKNIDISHIYITEHKTASNKIYVTELGDRFFSPANWDGGAFEKFRLSENDWKFVLSHDIIATVLNDPNLDELLNRVDLENKVIIDFSDYSTDVDRMRIIPHIDIAFVSARRKELPSLQKLSNDSGKMIVATLGAEGSIAYFNGKKVIQSAIKVPKVIDTTGCGDAFIAGFCTRWYENHNIEDALFNGAHAASEVLKYLGAVR